MQLADLASDAAQRVKRYLGRSPHFAGRDSILQILEEDVIRPVQIIQARVNHD